ncbi:MAG TPA: hypothetical protein VFN41_05330 [Candidatus Limnocylindrales bacterium]|nr:hypothetical protein [Candidatus Limnocylindrales bacterium]
MRTPPVPGRHIEIFFNDANRVVDVDTEDEDTSIVNVVIDAIERDDPDDAERILRDGLGGTVSRRG